jgi:hypothetical protein
MTETARRSGGERESGGACDECRRKPAERARGTNDVAARRWSEEAGEAARATIGSEAREVTERKESQ